MIIFAFRRQPTVMEYVHMAAISTTKVLAEALTECPLTILRVAAFDKKVRRDEAVGLRACTVKVDCEFLDDKNRKRVVVAIVELTEREANVWKPRFEGHYVTIDDDSPRWMGFRRSSPYDTEEKAAVWPVMRKMDPEAPFHDYRRLLPTS